MSDRFIAHWRLRSGDTVLSLHPDRESADRASYAHNACGLTLRQAKIAAATGQHGKVESLPWPVHVEARESRRPCPRCPGRMLTIADASPDLTVGCPACGYAVEAQPGEAMP